MVILLSVLIILFAAGYFIVNQRSFGVHPTGDRKEKIRKSPHYRNGAFQNINHTPSLSEDASFFGILGKFFFSDKSRRKPPGLIPAVKSDLHSLARNEDVLIWFGHSSYYLQVDGKRILVDPVFSGHASPFVFTAKAFAGSDLYKPADIPELDYLFLTHDHWDHLDYKTVLELKPKIKKIVCSLGTGAHLEHWGFDPAMFIEEDWNTTSKLENGFTITTAPARHFSGRGFKRNQVQWTSYILKTPNYNLYLGGDSGYDSHFKMIGDKFGPFDLAILENGQYDAAWKYIHMLPEEVLKAGKDLNAKRIFPVHSSKFSISNHDWDAPLKTVTELNRKYNQKVITPRIGEIVSLKNTEQVFDSWWTTVK